METVLQESKPAFLYERIVADIATRIDAGSLHEEDSEQGFAHLLEHLLFRESEALG